MADLRSRRHAATREAIIAATQELLVEEHGWTVPMDRIAERAGISRRTLYRFFPTRDDLLEAASAAWDQPDELRNLEAPRLRDIEDYLANQWVDLAANLPAVHAQRSSPTGREVRLRWVPRARAMGRVALASELGVEPDEISDDLIDMTVTVISSSTFLELHERLGHDAEHAAHLAAWIVEAIVQRATREGIPRP